MLRVILGSALFAIFAVFSMAQPAAASHPKDVTIEVGDFWFCDSNFQGQTCVTNIVEGATVTWDFSPMGILEFHTTTECGPACPPAVAYTPLWDSGHVGPGPGGAGDPTSYTFNTPGVYNYFCEVHPFTMNGQIVVGPVGGPSPTTTPADTVTPTGTATPTDTPTPTATAVPPAITAPPPVGGIAINPDVIALPAVGHGRSGRDADIFVAIAAVAAIAGVALAGARVFARRRLT